MPPFLSRKRALLVDPESTTEPSNKKVCSKQPPTKVRNISNSSKLPNNLRKNQSSEKGSEISEKLVAIDGSNSFSSDEFEDVPLEKGGTNINETDDEEENLEFEDIETPASPKLSNTLSFGDLELTLIKDNRISVTNPLGTKKAPSKIERQIRVSTHKCHVQTLMWHNAIRNSWLCDEKLQNILLELLPTSVVQQVEKWKQDSGLTSENLPKFDLNRKAGRSRVKKNGLQNQRNWGQPALRVDDSRVNMSAGDPLLRLLKILVKFWQQKFRINAPGLRKIGYMSLQRLDEELKNFNNSENDPTTNGECFRDLKDFRAHAIGMEGSRDFGAQLFTALLRAIGLKTRMVASLQPIGFGWSQNEEALDKNSCIIDQHGKDRTETDSSLGRKENLEVDVVNDNYSKTNNKMKKKSGDEKSSQNSKKTLTKRSIQKPSISLSRSYRANSSDSELSAPPSENETVPDINLAGRLNTPSPLHDDDLKHPHYWSEILSPVTKTYIPVDAMVNQIIASNRDLIEKFEPRTTKNEKMKQVIAYVVGHSSDGTAKDLTTRYLKGKLWPGKTKGYRYPPEKIAIRDHNGKFKHHIHRDWFKTLMSLYERGSKEYPRDEIDDLEDINDLKPIKREKKETDAGKETLQYYKTSPDFVLERHLKREEALIPNAQHVKMFTTGKGDGSSLEKVFLRKDVVVCKSAETWHKEGRAPLPGEEPLKRVPYRAATTNRRRELAEAEYSSGEKLLQGLFSRAQTEWIIPPPIKNGIIPKNSFGNIDLYVDSMLPKGAIHIPFRGIPRICKRLDLDYAEAVTGFEFGHRMAVPIITGVVVAESNYNVIMEEWQKDESERARKEEEKKKKTVYNMWKKMVIGLRIIKRFREEYGDIDKYAESSNPFTNSKKITSEIDDFTTKKETADQQDDSLAGGFLPQGVVIEESDICQSSGFFPVASQDEDEDNQGRDSDISVEYSNYLLQGERKLLTKDEKSDGITDDLGEDPTLKIVTRTRSEKNPQISMTSNTDDEIKHQKPKKRVKLPKKHGKNIKSRNKIDDQVDGNVVVTEDATRILRKNPRRNASRKASHAYRSHYFEHSDEE